MHRRHAPAALALVALPLLLAAATPAPKPAATKSQAPAARKALEAVTERYRTLKSYQFEGRALQLFTSQQGNQTNETSVSFKVTRPDRIASVLVQPEMTSRVVANGESLWTAVPQLGQYMVQLLADVRRDTDSAAYARQFDPAGPYAHLLDGVREVRSLGRDTVHTAGGVVRCDRYALVSDSPPQADGSITIHPRTVWVDPATKMVLLDSLRVDQEHAQLGSVSSTNITRMVVARPDPAFAADVFLFRPDDGMRRVRRFMRRSPEHADLEGRLAQDFTLTALQGGAPVKLSEQKGKVVLLDFWATWCGPCRGWLPIVAKAQREHAADGLQVYAVNLREPESKVRDYLTKQKIDVPVLMDRTGSVGADYRASSIPLTVIVGRDGRVVRVMVGLHGEEDLKDVLLEAGIN